MRMLVLDLAIMVVLLGMVLIAVLSGFELPANALDDLEMTAPIILGIVVAAPVIEEVIFRSWLSGKPGHVLAIAIVVIGVAAMVGVNLTIASPPLVAIIAIGALIGSLLAAFLLRKRGQMGWFARAFPWFFWGSTLVFAFIHVFNYEEGSILALLPLVLPQFALGTVCAYLRVNHGLWSAIVLHALHNGTVVLFVLSGLELLE